MDIVITEDLKAEDFEVLERLEQLVFPEPYEPGRLTREAQNKNKLMCLTALVDGRPVGFKLGYELEPGVFYSWLGGVMPEHRHKGVATALMAKQHRLLQEKAYKTVRTNCRNYLKAMLILNLKYGFDIIGTQWKEKEGYHSIHMEKALISS